MFLNKSFIQNIPKTITLGFFLKLVIFMSSFNIYKLIIYIDEITNTKIYYFLRQKL
jgi:hypothetical protein